MPAAPTPAASARRRHGMRRGVLALVLASLALGASGCRTPVRTTPVALQTAFARSDHDDASAPRPDLVAHDQLDCLGLDRLWRKDPATALAALETHALDAARPELFLALAELHHDQANRLRPRPEASAAIRGHHLAAAVYAWQVLAEPPDPESAARARSLYNRSLALALVAGASTQGELDLQPRPWQWPTTGAPVEIASGPRAESLAEVRRYLAAEAFALKGLRARHRIAGLGVPLVAELSPGPKGMVRAAPATLVARVVGTPYDFAFGRGRIDLDLFSPNETGTVATGARTEPLAADLSAPIAYALGRSTIWHLGRAQFSDLLQRVPTGIYLLQPHRAGRIPVVLVHGTLANPVSWAQMVNTLLADPVLRERCEFWFFLYNTGNPVPYSADLLRQALGAKIAELDPDARDPALHRLVLLGHSQGGLLVKLLACASGDALWRSVSAAPFDPRRYPEPQRELIARFFFFEPMPEVSRIVFLGTPHRGSRLIPGWRLPLSHLLVRLPEQVVGAAAAFFQYNDTAAMPAKVRRRVPNSIDIMSPRNPWLLALADIPVAPGIAAHSIIATNGHSAPDDSTDGVVDYSSAHLDGVASELAIPGNHKIPRNPAAIEEVRRILHEHLAAVAPPAVASP